MAARRAPRAEGDAHQRLERVRRRRVPGYFREAKLGPLVGTRTWGGLIGISGAPTLVDGGGVTVPTFRMYDVRGQWFAEGHGVEPDIEVEEDPAQLAKGTDPQLERAIAEAMRLVKEKPPAPPARPAYEKRVPGKVSAWLSWSPERSFRREERLRACRQMARQQVARTQALETGALGAARAAAQARAAAERVARVDEALAQLPLVEAAKRRNKTKSVARTSTTDPDARVMKLMDGGFRPAYNVQFATDVDGRAVVGVAVTNGGEQAALVPMLTQVQARTGRTPQAWLADGGYVSIEGICGVAARDVALYAPCPRRAPPRAVARRPRLRPSWRGGPGWRPTRGRRSTKSDRRPPNGSMRMPKRIVRFACSRSAACPRCTCGPCGPHSRSMCYA